MLHELRWLRVNEESVCTDLGAPEGRDLRPGGAALGLRLGRAGRLRHILDKLRATKHVGNFSTAPVSPASLIEILVVITEATYIVFIIHLLSYVSLISPYVLFDSFQCFKLSYSPGSHPRAGDVLCPGFGAWQRVGDARGFQDSGEDLTETFLFKSLFERP